MMARKRASHICRQCDRAVSRLVADCNTHCSMLPVTTSTSMFCSVSTGSHPAAARRITAYIVSSGIWRRVIELYESVVGCKRFRDAVGVRCRIQVGADPTFVSAARWQEGLTIEDVEQSVVSDLTS
jgi:hypothetical protein